MISSSPISLFRTNIITCLKSNGKAAVIHPHAVLFRGSAEATIRRETVKRGYIKGIIGLPANLFYGTGILSASYRLKFPAGEIKAAILGHLEFAAFKTSVNSIFTKWKKANSPLLNAIKPGDHPKARIETLSEALLTIFGKARLIDPYDVYQHLMDYWASTMKDDVYLIAHAGWVDVAKPRLIVENKEQKSKEQPVFKVGKKKFKSDLIPVALLIDRYFKSEQSAIDTLESELGQFEQHLEELREEHEREGGLLEEVVDEKGKITKKEVAARLKEIGHNAEEAEERKLLENYIALLDQQADAKSRLKGKQDELERKVAAKYGKLTEAEIKCLVVDDKWLAQLAADIQSELGRVSQTLTGRIRQLADRYASVLLLAPRGACRR